MRRTTRALLGVVATAIAGAVIFGFAATSASAQQNAAPREIVQVASDFLHSCAVQTDNTPVCWGFDGNGRTAPPAGITVSQISAGEEFSCAVQTDNTPICWGFDRFGITMTPAGITVSQVSAGGYHSCAVRTDNTPICWGREINGNKTPPAGITVSQVSAGIDHTCAVQTDNTPICWGFDGNGRTTPPAGITVTQISTDSGYSCAVQTDNTPICWGLERNGRTQPPAGIAVTQVSAGYSHSCAVQTDNTPICWGNNLDGRATPPAGITVIQIAAGAKHTCAVQTDNTPICWGANDKGQTDVPRQDTQPVAVDDSFVGVVGTPVQFDICANDTLGNMSRIDRISGGYPSGLSRGSFYNDTQCIISGTPTTVGTFTYRYRLTDFDGDTDDATATITINVPNQANFTCQANAGVITWTDAGQSKYWIYKSTDGGATYNWIGRTTGNPAPTTFTDPNPTPGATYQAHYAGLPRPTCTTTNEPTGGFTCQANAGVITWTDASQSKYWIYKSTDGGNTYNWIGRTTGNPAPTTFTDPNPTPGATYQAHYAGLPRPTCTTTNEPTGGFTCQANAGVITWTDASQSKYWIYKSTDGGNTYNWIGRTTGNPAPTTFTDPNPTPRATYQAHNPRLPRPTSTTTNEP